MIVLALALGLGTQDTATSLEIDREQYSSIERELDDVEESIVAAQVYTCLSSTRGAALRPYEQRFEQVKADARMVLGRDLNLEIWTNSCRMDAIPTGSSLRPPMR